MAGNETGTHTQPGRLRALRRPRAAPPPRSQRRRRPGRRGLRDPSPAAGSRPRGATPAPHRRSGPRSSQTFRRVGGVFEGTKGGQRRDAAGSEVSAVSALGGGLQPARCARCNTRAEPPVSRSRAFRSRAPKERSADPPPFPPPGPGCGNGSGGCGRRAWARRGRGSGGNSAHAGGSALAFLAEGTASVFPPRRSRQSRPAGRGEERGRLHLPEVPTPR